MGAAAPGLCRGTHRNLTRAYHRETPEHICVGIDREVAVLPKDFTPGNKSSDLGHGFQLIDNKEFANPT